MRLIFIILTFTLLINSVSAVNWQCEDLPYEQENNYTVVQGVNFSYSGAVESGTYPGYFIDTTYTVLNTLYRSNWSNSNSWNKINQPNFTIETLFLFSSPDAVHVKYCVDTDFIQNTPIPTVTIPVIPTPTTTSGSGSSEGVSTNQLCIDGNCSQYPSRYAEGSYGNLGEVSLPAESQGFRNVIEDSGYKATGKGFVAMLTDYSMLYMLIGMLFFFTKLTLGGD